MKAAAVPVRPQGLRVWRERAGLSRVRLAKLCPEPVDPATIYKLEKGRQSTTSLRLAFALAGTLAKELDESVTVEDLFPEFLSPIIAVPSAA